MLNRPPANRRIGGAAFANRGEELRFRVDAHAVSFGGVAQIGQFDRVLAGSKSIRRHFDLDLKTTGTWNDGRSGLSSKGTWPVRRHQYFAFRVDDAKQDVHTFLVRDHPQELAGGRIDSEYTGLSRPHIALHRVMQLQFSCLASCGWGTALRLRCCGEKRP